VVAKAHDVDGDLLLLCDVIASSQKYEELILKFGDRARARQLDELAQRVAALR
jgi:uncharacterized protein with von Willebrand factor type A (vWA) domain